MSVDVINPVQQNESSATTSNASSTTSTSSAADVDYEMFLQLLVAQMENQDPLNPAESTEYVAQLATFSQVEQTIQSNAKLDELITSLSLSQSDAVIGRTVTSADGSVSGKVQSVKVTNEGLVAYLEGGGSLTVGPGVTIS
ncbi:MAG: flagellar hook assembly protein FlgD [Filomicrobium sp.]